tara:strand:- start:2053 stop:3051 length:999 start_codon:yes stop_codon:yes gene_type:complete
LKSYNKNNFKNEFFVKKIFFFLIKKILNILIVKKTLYFLTYRFKNIFLTVNFKPLRGLIYDAISEKERIIKLKSKDEKLFIFSHDKFLSRDLFINNEFDLYKLKKVMKILNNKSLKTLYDIGANIGVISIPAVKRGYFEYAYAVEPEINNYNLLEKNVKLNNLNNKIFIYNYALSNSDDANLEMELSEDNSGDHRIRLPDPEISIHNENERKVLKVTSKKFDTLFKNLDPKKDLVWIDAQGYEPIIMDGAENLINSKTPVVIEFWPYGLKRNKLWEKIDIFLKKYDYFIDLGDSQNKKIQISQKSLEELKNGWDNEKKNSYSLFTDLLLMKN